MAHAILKPSAWSSQPSTFLQRRTRLSSSAARASCVREPSLPIAPCRTACRPAQWLRRPPRPAGSRITSAPQYEGPRPPLAIPSGQTHVPRESSHRPPPPPRHLSPPTYLLSAAPALPEQIAMTSPSLHGGYVSIGRGTPKKALAHAQTVRRSTHSSATPQRFSPTPHLFAEFAWS